jgi:hypothetical protein
MMDDDDILVLRARRPLSKTAAALASGPPPAIDRHFQPDFIRRSRLFTSGFGWRDGSFDRHAGLHLDTGRLAPDLVRQEQDLVALPAQRVAQWFRRRETGVPEVANLKSSKLSNSVAITDYGSENTGCAARLGIMVSAAR